MTRTFIIAALALAAGILTANLQAQGPVVTASTASLSFSWQQGAKLPATQALSVRISSGTPAYVDHDARQRLARFRVSACIAGSAG